MIKIVITSLLTLYSLSSFAMNDTYLSNLQLTENVSEELNIVITHLNTNEVSLEQAQTVAAACTLINNDVKSMDKVNLLFLLKSEIYKGLLNNQYLSYSDSIQISEVIIKSIEEKFKKYKITYSPFAVWIFESLIKDLAPYRRDNFINRFQTVSRTNMKEKAMALELTKALKYISPWVIAIESKTPEEFNETLTLISIDILKLISRKTYFFKEFASKYSANVRDGLFIIPQIKIEPTTNLDAAPDSLDEIKEQKKEKAKETIETLENTQDIEGSKKALDNLIQEKTEKEDGWVPKE